MKKISLRLRGKFSIIILITSIVSVFLVFIMTYLYFSFFADENLRNFFKIREYIDSTFFKVEKAEDLKFDEMKFPDSINLTIIDSKGTILFNYNSIGGNPELPPVPLGATKVGSKDYKELMQDNFRKIIDRNFIAESFYNKDAGIRLILIHINQTERPHNYWLLFLTAIIGLTVIIGTLTSSFFLRSTSKSISNLETAAVKIAAGNLDFEMEAGGDKEVVNLKNSFEIMRKSIKSERASRNRFIMSVSHDLKTPLTSIRGYLEAINDGLASDPETQKRYINIIQKKSRLLESRILELIDFAKMETGEWQLKAEQISIKKAAESLSDIFVNDAELFNKAYKANINIDESLTSNIDEQLFIRLFENLFSNAVRYTEKDSTIYFNVMQIERDVVLELRDTGKGISRKDLNLIFEPFYRADKGRNEPGLGLGLTVVKSVIDAHGWKLEVTSKEREGTSFAVRIPSFLVYNIELKA